MTGSLTDRTAVNLSQPAVRTRAAGRSHAAVPRRAPCSQIRCASVRMRRGAAAAVEDWEEGAAGEEGAAAVEDARAKQPSRKGLMTYPSGRGEIGGVALSMADRKLWRQV